MRNKSAYSVQTMPRRTVSMSMFLSWAIDDAATSFAASMEYVSLLKSVSPNRV